MYPRVPSPPPSAPENGQRRRDLRGRSRVPDAGFYWEEEPRLSVSILRLFIDDFLVDPWHDDKKQYTDG